MVAGKSFFFSKIGVQSCVRFRCTLLHSYFALHISQTYGISIRQLEANNPEIVPNNLQIGTLLYGEKEVRKSETSKKSNRVKSIRAIKIQNLRSFTYIYEKPTDTSKRMGKAMSGDRFYISGSVEGWWEVIFNNQRCYIKEKYGKLV